MPPTKLVSAPESCRTSAAYTVDRNLNAQNTYPDGRVRTSQTKTGPLLSHFIAVATMTMSGSDKVINAQAIMRSTSRSNRGQVEFERHQPPTNDGFSLLTGWTMSIAGELGVAPLGKSLVISKCFV